MTLALIAGAGALPGRVLGAVRAEGRRALVCEMAGSAAEVPGGPDIRFRLETLGTLLADLRGEGVREVCFAGAVRRPPVDPAAVDAATRPLMERIAAALRAGDDGALRTMLGLFEEAGLAVRGAHDLVPDLLPPAGVPSAAKPADAHGADAGRAAAIVAALGRVDVGQACVVSRGQALAIEALPGTDAMLATLCPRPPGLPGGGLLYKAPKPGQDRRVDLPAVGPTTLEGAARAGLDGVVIEAGGVMVLDRPATVAAADRLGLFLWVREPGPAGAAG